MRTQGPRSRVKYVMLIENRWFCVCVRGMQSESAALWGLLATLEVTGWKEFTNNWILTASARGNGNNHTYPRTHLLRIILRVLFRVFERRVTFRIAGTICYFQYSAPVGGWEGGWKGCLHKSSPSRDTVCWSWPRKVNFPFVRSICRKLSLWTLAVLWVLALLQEDKTRKSGWQHRQVQLTRRWELVDTERGEKCVFFPRRSCRYIEIFKVTQRVGSY